MRELLIRYLLGELDDFERRDLQTQLRESPELRRELAHLRACFSANQSEDEPAGLPGDLAERTTERVTNCDDDSLTAMPRESRAFAATGDPPAGVLGWSLADLTVAGGVMLAVSMLVFPALRDSRDGTRRHVCENNQRQIGVIVMKFAADNGGYLPPVGPHDNAGEFVARLIEKGDVDPDELALLLICPGAPVAGEIRAKRFVMRIPTADVVRAMSPAQRRAFTAQATPSYACRIGYWADHKYHDVRYDGLTFSPVVGDAPTDAQSAALSPNHGGRVCQILFWDGSVRSFTTSKLPGVGDDMYRNSLGKVAAGRGREDTVLACSNTTPGAEFTAPGK